MDPLDLIGPDFKERLKKFLAPGVDPYAYAVSSERVRRVIRETDAQQEVKEYLLNNLEPLLAKADVVSCLVLGVMIGQLAKFTRHPVEFKKVSDNLRDMDKLPYVIANGNRVN